jgi:hypothetical protein
MEIIGIILLGTIFAVVLDPLYDIYFRKIVRIKDHKKSKQERTFIVITSILLVFLIT